MHPGTPMVVPCALGAPKAFVAPSARRAGQPRHCRRAQWCSRAAPVERCKRSVAAAAGGTAPTSAATAPAAAGSRPPQPRGAERSHTTDVVVIGAGIGGLCAAALLAKYGCKVTVCESHTQAGGAAHAWSRDGFHFESGPSLYSGMAARGPGANPLAHVFQAVGEELELIKYSGWNVVLPEGQFWMEVGAEPFTQVLARLRGPEAVAEWSRLQDAMRPLAAAVTALPAAAFRSDAGAALTAGLRYLPKLLTTGPDALKLTGPFSKILDSVPISDPFIRRWMDLLCFLLSGLPADGTIAAEVAFMFQEWYRPDCHLEFPRGGSGAMVAALVRAIEKRGGRVLTSAHVDQIVMRGGRAAGVRLRGGGEISASKAVIANSFGQATMKLLPEGAAPAEWRRAQEATPLCPSFMHLHVGFDAAGVQDLPLHHIIVNDWERGVAAEQNVVLVSIPSVIDPSMAPPGHHSLHAYLPATEPWGFWKDVQRGSPEYQRLKEERSQVLWQAVERLVPDIRSRAKLSLVGTPLTHAAFLRRPRGTYGPAVAAGGPDPPLPGAATPIPGLYQCGDGTFPGIGLPAVAGSGMVAANTLAGVGQHWALLNELGV